MVRTRFAPSPTGYLHIGGARTALFNWLFARHEGGKFILRIEDTDVARSTKESVEAILESMRWLGLDWDEGPYYQSQRKDVYTDFVNSLLQADRAYRCFCTQEELEVHRHQALKEGKQPKYDGRCRDLKGMFPDRPFVVRFKTPINETTRFNDLIKGQISYQNADLDDFIIMRSDGTVTYNFAVVVDDLTMGITHIIRGDDHINNTPRQILIYQALNSDLPCFAHVPLIMGQDKSRLSKRHGATSVSAYREMGYLPQALVNYLVRLGWSYGDQEIFSREEIIQKFTLEDVGKSAGIFNPEKLLWLNSHYIKTSSPDSLVDFLFSFLTEKGYQNTDRNHLVQKIPLFQERSKTLKDMAEGMSFYFEDEISYDHKGAKKFLNPEILPILNQINERIENLEALSTQNLEIIFREISESENVPLMKMAQAVRVSLTGSTVSPGIFEVMETLGKNKVLKRLDKVCKYIKSLVI